MPGAFAGEVAILRQPWLPEWGLDLAFRFDGLGLLFSILILGIGQLIVLYATFYMPKQDGLGRFFGILMAFAGSMLGIVLSENLLLLVVFWEITSLTSFLLIAYKHDSFEARIAARMALAVTGGGGLALLAGVLLLGHMAGSYELQDVLAAGDRIRGHELYGSAPIRATPSRWCWCCSAPSPNRRSSPSISGCRTRWRRRPRSAPTCIPRPW
jgi:multicomponent K+:H+ antiporter subunit A